MGIGHLGLFAGSCRDEAVEETEDRDGTQADADDGTVDMLMGDYRGIQLVRCLPVVLRDVDRSHGSI